MVYQRLILPQRVIPHLLELGLDLALDLLVVRHVLERAFGLFRDAEGERRVELVDQL